MAEPSQSAPPPGRRARRPHRPGDIVIDERGEALELRDELGGGGQGTVWSLPGDQAAVKILRADAGVSADSLRMRLAAVRRFDLTGIPIARPLSLLRGDDIGYTMELLASMTSIGSLAAVPGSGVAEWFLGTGGLRRRLRLLALTAEALDRLHARGIAYGDISPGNILVSAGSGHDQVWLIDPDNLSVQARPVGPAQVTPGYGAPELLSGARLQDSLTDAFSFAVLAFQILVLAHPLIGDAVYQDPGRLEPLAFHGGLPWIDHATDGRNRSSQGLDRGLVLTRGLRRLASRAFQDGLHDPGQRPSLGEWHEKLDQAALLMIACPACGGTYHASRSVCPWCRKRERPAILRCDIHGYLPAGRLAETVAATETDRLESIILPAGQPQVIAARNGLLCLDPGPSGLPADPGEPLAEINWDEGTRLLIRRIGRHDAWLVSQSGGQVIALGIGDTRALDVTEIGHWGLHFGPPGEPHRFVRILRPRPGEKR